MVGDKNTTKRKGNLELAEQHIELAEQLILEEDKNAEEKDENLLKGAAFALEKAEADLDEAGSN